MGTIKKIIQSLLGILPIIMICINFLVISKSKGYIYKYSNLVPVSNQIIIYPSSTIIVEKQIFFYLENKAAAASELYKINKAKSILIGEYSKEKLEYIERKLNDYGVPSSSISAVLITDDNPFVEHIKTDKVILVTDDFAMENILYCVKNNGSNVVGLPAPIIKSRYKYYYQFIGFFNKVITFVTINTKG